ncbi:MAG TPA: LytTR family transcriptional regulator, partial [Roseovarius sp.]|nr:LytTR family transcriptional regulator [Roseovarius sp.]
MSLLSIGFTTPWLLWALVALPLLWILLRAVPPAPVRRRFPGVALLLGLRDEDSVSDRTPWWLLLLRMLTVAAAIVGLAGPVLNPRDAGGTASTAPLLIVVEDGWAAARDWPAQRAAIEAQLAQAARDGRTAALMRLSAPERPVFRAAADLRSRLPGLAPAPWSARPESYAEAAALLPEGAVETRWFSDGLDRDGREDLLSALEARGPVVVHESARPVLALAPPGLEDGMVALRALRAGAEGARDVEIAAHGRDPGGAERVLA